MLFFDIETKANPVTLKFMEQPTAPGNYKDPDKIQAYIDNKMVEMVEKAALDADYGQIVAIGYKEDDQDIQSMIIAEMSEEEMLKTFWEKYRVHGGNSCGYNIIGFDLPYMMRRSFELGIHVPLIPYLNKYQVAPTCDLMGILYGWSSAKNLKWVVERYGLDNPLPELEGSQVAEMDNETLKAYVENDVYITYQLWQKMSGVYF